MFIVKPSVIILEALVLCLVLLERCQQVLSASEKYLDFVRLFEVEFGQWKIISIEYAIMEKTQKAVVVPVAVACGLE